MLFRRHRGRRGYRDLSAASTARAWRWSFSLASKPSSAAIAWPGRNARPGW